MERQCSSSGGSVNVSHWLYQRQSDKRARSSSSVHHICFSDGQIFTTSKPTNIITTSNYTSQPTLSPPVSQPTLSVSAVTYPSLTENKCNHTIPTSNLISLTLTTSDLCASASQPLMNFCQSLIMIINWVVRALNADWLTAVVYQTVYHGYDKTFIFTLITLATSL